MSFGPNAQLDPGQLQDRRGRIGGRGIAVGGGGLGLVFVIAYLLLGGDPSTGREPISGGAGGLSGPDATTLQQEASDRQRRQSALTAGSSASTASRRTFVEFKPRRAYGRGTVLFPTRPRRAGPAFSAVGPFYCQITSPDSGSSTTQQHSARGGLAEAYVVAHEYDITSRSAGHPGTRLGDGAMAHPSGSS
jgi:predicted metalloprotease